MNKCGEVRTFDIKRVTLIGRFPAVPPDQKIISKLYHIYIIMVCNNIPSENIIVLYL